MEFTINRDVFLKSLGHAMELLKKKQHYQFYQIY